jgi:hypothetical protein
MKKVLLTVLLAMLAVGSLSAQSRIGGDNSGIFGGNK